MAEDAREEGRKKKRASGMELIACGLDLPLETVKGL
jgi:hypothetical protein